jgi:murein DD-endopeptidase MepM/ murein hydrolase activator NlpD
MNKEILLSAGLVLLPLPAFATGSLDLEQQQFLEEASPVVTSKKLEAEQQNFLTEPSPALKPEVVAYRASRQYQSYTHPYIERRPEIPSERPIIRYRPQRQIWRAPRPRAKPLADLTKPQSYSRVSIQKATIQPPLQSFFKAAEPFIYPLVYPVQVTSPFGWRIHPISGVQKFHTGTDLAAEQGTPILTVFSGQVTFAGDAGGYGFLVEVQHSETLRSRYAHMSQILVQVGQSLQRGTAIGVVGSTGNSTGPHLHFEMQEFVGSEWKSVDSTRMVELAGERLSQILASNKNYVR